MHPDQAARTKQLIDHTKKSTSKVKTSPKPPKKVKKKSLYNPRKYTYVSCYFPSG